ncbi:hypothetical protein HOY82DRAFT_593023 [Tuber indicum]|nr:hypothetical protein HOY82DRAFT_593023 [Tuber indicum]
MCLKACAMQMNSQIRIHSRISPHQKPYPVYICAGASVLILLSVLLPMSSTSIYLFLLLVKFGFSLQSTYNPRLMQAQAGLKLHPEYSQASQARGKRGLHDSRFWLDPSLHAGSSRA